MATRSPRDAVITGIGLISPLAEGVADHVRLLTGEALPQPGIDAESFAPYPFHPLVEVDLSLQIPKRDQRQMETWQRYGTYAAGLALADAGLAGNEAVLSEAGLIVAAGGGERDPEVDGAILEGMANAGDRDAFLNERLMSDLRPTLFLAQLTNLLAGNISIVHHVTGSSRSFMGEELAGAMALQTAMRQIGAGQGDVFLVGGAYSAGRPDMLLYFACGDYLLEGSEVPPVWQRGGGRGGLVCGSMGAFLVIEAREHAQKRGARIYARLEDVVADRGSREDASALRARAARQTARLEELAGDAPIGLLSGASGAAGALALGESPEARGVLARFGTLALPMSQLQPLFDSHFPRASALLPRFDGELPAVGGGRMGIIRCLDVAARLRGGANERSTDSGKPVSAPGV